MPTKIRQCLTVIGSVCLALSIGFILATPFLPLRPFWQQLAVGFALMELQMALWLGPAMAIRVSHLRQEMVKKADVKTYGRPDVDINIYATLNIQHLES